MRAQTSLEYLITFGIALIVVSIVGLSLWRMGVFTPYEKEIVLESPKNLEITSFELKDGTLNFSLSNLRLGTDARIEKVEINGSLTGSTNESRVISVEGTKEFSIDLGGCEDGRYYTLELKIYYRKLLPSGWSSLLSVDVGRIRVLCKRIWLKGWEYRREVEIQENSGNTLYEYQVKISLDTSSLISQGKMKPDCSDIRVTDSDKLTLLPYWVEEDTCNTPNTVIWVKVPKIPAGGVKKIYLYYGNPDANDESDGRKVFIVFDDFNRDTLGDYWNVSCPSPSYYTLSGDYISLYDRSTSGVCSIYRSIDVNYSFSWEVKVRFHETWTYHYPFFFTGFNGTSYSSAYWGDTDNTNRWAYYIGSSWYPDYLFNGNYKTVTSGVWYRLSVIWNKDANQHFIIVDEDVSSPVPSKLSNGNYVRKFVYAKVLASAGSYRGGFDLDWAFLRKWVPNEPNVYVGEEERY